MRDSAEDDEGPLEEHDARDGEPDAAEGAGEYAGTGAYDDEEPEYYEEQMDDHSGEAGLLVGDQEAGADDVYQVAAVPADEGSEDMAVPGEGPVARRRAADAEPDVYLDVPLLQVDEIDLDVENLRAHVSLQAEVLDLLKLNVGADVALGRVHLGISGVEARAQLKVRLDNVAAIIDRVLTTLDRNPQILEDLTRGIGSAVQDIGGGARQAVGELGAGTGRAVGDIGRGAGSAVRDVGRGAGEGVRDVGRGVGRGVEDVSRGAGAAVGDVGRAAGSAVGDVGRGAGRTVDEAAGAVGGVVTHAGEAAGDVTASTVGRTARAGGEVVEDAADGGAGVVEDVPEVMDVPDVAESPGRAGGTVRRAARPARSAAREPGDEHRDPAVRGRGGARGRRIRGEDGKLPPRPGRRRAAGETDEPP
ncbi:hypothetical protein [Streptomyces sp. NPDC018610]|uniref:hypothetical protein n=1 Tax=Streptomyces sp. NPDC018610 TaxID=3365049 RepID=UPI0037A6FFE8